ncbi:MAG: UMP kinase [Erysipelotrichaceae bacterium]|nr:UMP kinase [Erysipelotrichaceae bacterium]
MALRRVLLKLSGEALKENGDLILSAGALTHMAEMIKAIIDSGVQVCVVVGAGNIWRGKIASDAGMERVQADYMGMMGTVINAVALASKLKDLGTSSIVTSAISAIEGITIPYVVEIADQALNNGQVVFLAGGTGKPYFTTDTAAAMRAIELKCDAILMGKNGVNGVYDKDPRTNADAKFFKFITFDEMLKLNLQIMDTSAIQLIKDENIKVCVFQMEANNFIATAKGEHVGTICHKGE